MSYAVSKLLSSSQILILISHILLFNMLITKTNEKFALQADSNYIETGILCRVSLTSSCFFEFSKLICFHINVYNAKLFKCLQFGDLNGEKLIDMARSLSLYSLCLFYTFCLSLPLSICLSFPLSKQFSNFLCLTFVPQRFPCFPLLLTTLLIVFILMYNVL